MSHEYMDFFLTLTLLHLNSDVQEVIGFEEACSNSHGFFKCLLWDMEASICWSGKRVPGLLQGLQVQAPEIKGRGRGRANSGLWFTVPGAWDAKRATQKKSKDPWGHSRRGERMDNKHNR